MDWILGFRTRALIQREVASGASTFLGDVFINNMPPARARLRAFGGPGTALEHTGVVLYQRLDDNSIKIDCLIRFSATRGLWGPVKACPCDFNAWSANHIVHRLKKGGDTKTITLRCPTCKLQGTVHGVGSVQFVSAPTKITGEAYSLDLVNHFVVPMPIEPFEIRYKAEPVRHRTFYQISNQRLFKFIQTLHDKRKADVMDAPSNHGEQTGSPRASKKRRNHSKNQAD